MTDTMLFYILRMFWKDKSSHQWQSGQQSCLWLYAIYHGYPQVLKVGDNEIQVIVHTDDDPNGRWYSGAGLYRGVNLLSAPAFHIAHDGIFVYTDHITNGDAFCKAEITVVNDLAKASGDAEGFLKLSAAKKDTGEEVAVRYQKISLPANALSSSSTGFCY